MITSTNRASLYAIQAANKWADAAATSSERISTTLRINHSSDDPSGLMMATSLSAELRSYTSAITNIHSGISAVQMVDGSTSTLDIQAGIASGDSRTLSFSSATAASLGLSALDVSTDASTAITTIDTALETIASYQSKMGAYETLLDARETLAKKLPPP